jgi:hypothetical protein
LQSVKSSIIFLPNISEKYFINILNEKKLKTRDLLTYNVHVVKISWVNYIHISLKESHDTNSFTEHQILDQCKTKRTENFFKCGEGYTLNNRRLPMGDELQSFDVF